MMKKDYDSIELDFLNKINGDEMNITTSYQKFESWETTVSSPTINSTMRGDTTYKIDAEKRAQPKKTFGFLFPLYYIYEVIKNYF